MNRLQAIESTRPLLVTLNRAESIDDRAVLAEVEYAHPVFDTAAIVGSTPTRRDPGPERDLLRGCVLGLRFHEDGVQRRRTTLSRRSRPTS